MKIKTSELIGPALDWVVATALGHKAGQIKAHGPVHLFREIGYSPYQFSPSTTGSEVIEIMEREKIRVEPWTDKARAWAALAYKFQGWANPTSEFVFGPTLHIAVCRCFVASKLGDEVDVPKELMK